MRMAGLRVWVAVLVLLGAGPVRAECWPTYDEMTPRERSSGEQETALGAYEIIAGDRLTEDADLAWKRPGQAVSYDAGKCAAALLATLANSEQTLSLGASMSENMRNVQFAQLALAYLKVRSFPSYKQRGMIEQWLIEFADMANEKANLPGSHRYWLGLGLGAVGMAAGSDRLWEAARWIAEEAAREIGADGALAVELVRKEKALQGHVFALMPLVTLATLARAQGEDFYALGDGAIDRLAGYVAKGLREQPEVKPGAGWSQLYALHAADAAGAKIGMPRSFVGLGGDVQILVRALGASEQE